MTTQIFVVTSVRMDCPTTITHRGAGVNHDFCRLGNPWIAHDGVVSTIRPLLREGKLRASRSARERNEGFRGRPSGKRERMAIHGSLDLCHPPQLQKSGPRPRRLAGRR